MSAQLPARVTDTHACVCMRRYLQSADALEQPSLLQYGLMRLQTAMDKLEAKSFARDHGAAAYRDALKAGLQHTMAVSLQGGESQTSAAWRLVTAGQCSC